MKYFAVIIFLLCVGLVSCQKLLTKKDCDDFRKGIKSLETFVESVKKVYQLTDEVLIYSGLMSFSYLNITEQLTTTLINEELHFEMLLYSIECNTDNPTYSLMKTSYDSSKDNGILACTIIGAICTLLFNWYMIYITYSAKAKIDRIYDRVPT